MSLYSLAFVLFMSALVASYYLVGHLLGRGQWVVLLVGSLAFYCLMGTWRTLGYVVATAAATWAAPLALARMDAACAEERRAAPGRDARRAVRARWARRRRALLVAALCVPFGILACLKYRGEVLALVGAGGAAGPGLVLPLGISFYTFQSVGYLLDAYNGKGRAEPSFLRHLLFVTWFPQMIQGPINRHAELAPQLMATRRAGEVDPLRAMLLVGYGMLKKFVMADLLVGVISKLLGASGPSSPGSLAALAILMYSAQQYGDFSGGIDMVEGLSEMFGIRMARNFSRPYLSVSLADFWRRWHMSLGSWMRDYVFYPLALTRPMKALGRRLGARFGRHIGRTVPAGVANVVVFLLVGVWHGAEWHFVAWGLYNGLVIASTDLLAPAYARLAERLRIDVSSAWFHAFRVLRTFLVVNIGWYFDRIEDVGEALSCLGRTLLSFDLAGLPAALASAGLTGAERAQVILASAAALVVLAVSLMQERGVDVRGGVARMPLALRTAVCVLVGLLVVTSFTFNVGGGFMYANY